MNEQCLHDRSGMCWSCFHALVNGEVERWMRRHEQIGYLTRDPALVRANITRGLLLGTYQVGTQARARYTGVPAYGKIVGQSEYSEAGDALTSRPLAPAS